MTDFVGLKRNLTTEKERLEKLEETLKQKTTSTITELKTAIDFLEKTEAQFGKLDSSLSERKNDDINNSDQKKSILTDIESLKEQIERIKLSVKDEDNKISINTGELSQLESKLMETKNSLRSTEALLTETNSTIESKTKEKEELVSRMESRIVEAQKNLEGLQSEKAQDARVSPILDFLLKEVRIDIPEVEILSTLAYHGKAMGLSDLKSKVSKTPPVIILKVIRNLDSKGIIKYDENLDTIEITANLI